MSVVYSLLLSWLRKVWMVFLLCLKKFYWLIWWLVIRLVCCRVVRCIDMVDWERLVCWLNLLV